MDLSDKRLDRTGSWLFDTKEYQMWEAGKSPFFLLEGRGNLIKQSVSDLQLTQTQLGRASR